MSRQLRAIVSASKAARKAKKEKAAKADQDLAPAFDTEMITAPYEVDIDALEDSLLIPRKPVAIPVSSIALSNPPMEFKGDLKDPPKEVEINVQDHPLHRKTHWICLFQRSVCN